MRERSPQTKKMLGWLFLLLGIISILTPFTPFGFLGLIGLEMLGLRSTLWDKIRRQFGK
jgi:hypothetical protein